MFRHAICSSGAEQPAHDRVVNAEHGLALVVVLLSMSLICALSLALTLLASTEMRIAAHHRWSAETFFAADAAVERAILDLSRAGDWTGVLNGAFVSTFVDGPPGVRILTDGSRLDLSEATDTLNCGHASCSSDELIANTVERPWGANNPIWRLYAHAPLSALSLSGSIDSRVYLMVWVADDPLETDADPLVDGDESHGPNPGRGVLQLRAQAYGTAGSVQTIEVTLHRVLTRTRVLSWRVVRQ
ncbi:MAG TPA: PilX N-terminal domain-containing pilus assembly protein [Vicinamibacterales bacterium]|nr:PilX N-terminal domain-containing pilus assembly protein [Vicinamibacterales bacterium]